MVRLNPQDCKVLVIGDLDSERKIYSDYLLHMGFQVGVASHFEDCLQQVSERRPDLIFLDLWISNEDNLDTAKSLKKDERTRDIPLVLIANRSYLQPPQLGHEGIVYKPCLSKDIEKEVARVLRVHGKLLGVIRLTVPGSYASSDR